VPITKLAIQMRVLRVKFVHSGGACANDHHLRHQGGGVIDDYRLKPNWTVVRIRPLLILDSPCAVSPTSQPNYHLHMLQDDPDTDGYHLGGTSEHRKSWQLSGNAEAILQPPSGLPAQYSGYTTTSRRWRTDRRRTMHVTAMTAEVISTVLSSSLSGPDWRRETCKVRHDEKDGATSVG
jgi:hypothetical protein